VNKLKQPYLYTEQWSTFLTNRGTSTPHITAFHGPQKSPSRTKHQSTQPRDSLSAYRLTNLSGVYTMIHVWGTCMAYVFDGHVLCSIYTVAHYVIHEQHTECFVRCAFSSYLYRCGLIMQRSFQEMLTLLHTMRSLFQFLW